FSCPITMEVMSDPVTSCDGHTYERSSIETWFRQNASSPLTGAVLGSKSLLPNIALKNAIQEWHTQNA
ncbi:hypothetical protein GUITHDRAFT_53498, partial [Guillardia theta CCMP2712]